MVRRIWGIRLASGVLACCALSVGTGRQAQAQVITLPWYAASPKKGGASAIADKAQREMNARNYAAAAEDFEAAYEQSPNPKWLCDAARARVKNDEPDKAASLYSRCATESKGAAKSKAEKELARLTALVGRLQITAIGASKVTVDGSSVDPSQVVYVTEGSHRVQAAFSTGTASESRNVAAGQLATVTVEAPPDPAIAAQAALAAKGDGAGNDDKDSASRKPLPPLAVYIGGGATLLAGGLTVWSGLDTVEQKKVYEADKTQANLDEGKAKQSRTNVLLITTGGLAVATAVMAVWFVDWKHGSSTPASEKSSSDSGVQVSIAPGLGSLAVVGKF